MHAPSTVPAVTVVVVMMMMILLTIVMWCNATFRSVGSLLVFSQRRCGLSIFCCIFRSIVFFQTLSFNSFIHSSLLSVTQQQQQQHTQGYRRYYHGLRDFLSSQPEVAPHIEIVPNEDAGITGNFEVTVRDTGHVLHSKRTRRQGKADSSAERYAIVEQIKALICADA